MAQLGLTDLQRRTYDFVRASLEANGIPPSYAEIQEHLGLASKSGVVRLIDALVERGWLTRMKHRPRSIALAQEDPYTDLAAALRRFFHGANSKAMWRKRRDAVDELVERIGRQAAEDLKMTNDETR